MNRLLYFTDSSRGVIEVYDLTKRIRRILVADSTGGDSSSGERGFSPQSIAISVAQGLMFWSDYSDNLDEVTGYNNGKIYRANTDGTSLNAFIFDNLEQPTALSLNSDKRVLVYLEKGTNKVFSIGFDKSNHKQVITGIPESETLNSMAWVGKNLRLGYSQKDKHTVVPYEFEAGSDLVLAPPGVGQVDNLNNFRQPEITSFADDSDTTKQIQSITSVSHKIGSITPVEECKCTNSAICLPRSKDSTQLARPGQGDYYSCACGTGLSFLNMENTDCRAAPVKVLYFSTVGNIRSYSILNDRSQRVNQALSFYSSGFGQNNWPKPLTEAVALSVYTNGRSGSKLMFADKNQNQIFGLNISHPELPAELYFESQAPITDMACDEEIGNCYWLSQSNYKQAIFIGSIDKRKSSCLDSKTIEGQALAISVTGDSNDLIWSSDTTRTVGNTNAGSGKRTTLETSFIYMADIMKTNFPIEVFSENDFKTLEFKSSEMPLPKISCRPTKLVHFNFRYLKNWPTLHKEDPSKQDSRVYFVCENREKHLGDLIVSVKSFEVYSYLKNIQKNKGQQNNNGRKVEVSERDLRMGFAKELCS